MTTVEELKNIQHLILSSDAEAILLGASLFKDVKIEVQIPSNQKYLTKKHKLISYLLTQYVELYNSSEEAKFHYYNLSQILKEIRWGIIWLINGIYLDNERKIII